MVVKVYIDWNKEKCKWNIYHNGEISICHDIISKNPPIFEISTEGGQYRGKVCIEGVLTIRKENYKTIAYID